MKIYILILPFLFLQCKKDNSNTTKEVSSKPQDSTKVAITKKQLEKLKYNDYVLSQPAENQLANWQKYQELALQLNYLKKADLSFFKTEKKQLKGFLDTLMLQLPDTINTKLVNSRVLVLQTQILKLNNNLNLHTTSTQTQLQNIQEVFAAFSNLNFQINKKLEKDVYDKIKPE